MRRITILTVLLLTGCGGSGESPASADVELGGACFAGCGAGISACYSGSEMSASECQSIADNMCPDNADATFVAGCECSDDPVQGPADCE